MIRHVFNGNNRRVENALSLEDLPRLPRAPDAEQRAAIAVRHREQRASRPDDRGRRAGGGLGVLSGDVLPVRLRHGPEHRRDRADRTGLGRGRTRQGQGGCRRDARDRPRPRHHGCAVRRLVQPAIDDRARDAARYPRPGQRLCARHAADDAARLRLPADERDAAGRRRHADAAAGAGLVDRDRPDPDAAPDPRRVRPSGHRRDGPGLGVGYCQRADAVRARFISAPQEEPAGAGRRISAQASARRCPARQDPGHRNPERGRHGGDGDRRTGAARPRQRLRF